MFFRENRKYRIEDISVLLVVFIDLCFFERYKVVKFHYYVWIVSN